MGCIPSPSNRLPPCNAFENAGKLMMMGWALQRAEPEVN